MLARIPSSRRHQTVKPALPNIFPLPVNFFVTIQTLPAKRHLISAFNTLIFGRIIFFSSRFRGEQNSRRTMKRRIFKFYSLLAAACGAIPGRRCSMQSFSRVVGLGTQTVIVRYFVHRFGERSWHE